MMVPRDREIELRKMRFASLREAQAVWRVLHGEDPLAVSENLGIPTDHLQVWCQRVATALHAGSTVARHHTSLAG